MKQWSHRWLKLLISFVRKEMLTIVVLIYRILFEGWQSGSSDKSACLASMRPWVQTPLPMYPPKKKTASWVGCLQNITMMATLIKIVLHTLSHLILTKTYGWMLLRPKKWGGCVCVLLRFDSITLIHTPTPKKQDVKTQKYQNQDLN
jgi:hypothetical protein